MSFLTLKNVWCSRRLIAMIMNVVIEKIFLIGSNCKCFWNVHRMYQLHSSNIIVHCVVSFSVRVNCKSTLMYIYTWMSSTDYPKTTQRSDSEAHSRKNIEKSPIEKCFDIESFTGHTSQCQRFCELICLNVYSSKAHLIHSSRSYPTKMWHEAT